MGRVTIKEKTNRLQTVAPGVVTFDPSAGAHSNRGPVFGNRESQFCRKLFRSTAHEQFTAHDGIDAFFGLRSGHHRLCHRHGLQDLVLNSARRQQGGDNSRRMSKIGPDIFDPAGHTDARMCGEALNSGGRIRADNTELEIEPVLR